MKGMGTNSSLMYYNMKKKSPHDDDMMPKQAIASAKRKTVAMKQ